MTAFVEVRGLSVGLDQGPPIVDSVSFTLGRGEILGLVGESGSGKSTLGLALLGHARRGVAIRSGAITIGGVDVLAADARTLRGIRGALVSYIPQDPSVALDPSQRVGDQLMEMFRSHWADTSSTARRERLHEVLAETALPSDDAFLERYAHQLSGGQQQRIAIAMAFVCRPRLIVCDEPTTGLDVTTQAHVLATLATMARAHEVSAVYISHDIAAVRQVADRAAVMYAGRLVEQGPIDVITRSPRHPYTSALLRSVPSLHGDEALEGIPGHAPHPQERGRGCDFADRCPIVIDRCRTAFPPTTMIAKDHSVHCYRAAAEPQAVARIARRPLPATGAPVLEAVSLRASYGDRRVLHGIDLNLAGGECLAVVGESGSGKTTLARCLAGLHPPDDGTVRLSGDLVSRRSRDRTIEQRRALQFIYQSPYASLNPRRSIGRSISRVVELLTGARPEVARRDALDALARVELPRFAYDRYPDELSGGERQRVAIARALAPGPSILVCDEVTSALDVSVQAAIIDLLGQLQRDSGLALVFVTHNLALVRAIAQRAIVLKDGSLVEEGPTRRIFQSPDSEYTSRLLRDTPALQPASRQAADMTSETLDRVVAPGRMEPMPH